MSNLISSQDLLGITAAVKYDGRIVVVGGCFDILHPGHIAFLNAAKKEGESLVLLLESDESIKKRKGPERPIHLQLERAKALSLLGIVDTIILLDGSLSNTEYDNLILAIKPAIIATTKGDQHRFHKERQAELTGAKVVDVIDRLTEYSTTDLLKK